MPTPLYLLFSLFIASVLPSPSDSSQILSWTHDRTLSRSYLFSNIHWWESLDHQLTSIISLLAIAQNTSCIAVLPAIPSTKGIQLGNGSLVGDYFDITAIRKVQPVITLSEFMGSEDYGLLKAEKSGSVPLPKSSQEEYETRLGILGRISDTLVSLEMPDVDPEHTNHKCDRFSGTMHVVRNRRFVFLDRVHFAHFCTERFLPWWYDIRHRITPIKVYLDAAQHFLTDKQGPMAVIHVSDLMETQKDRDEEEIERYARQIVDALRKTQALEGSMYVIHAKNGRHVKRVVRLLRQEFERVYDCADLFQCGTKVPRDIFDPSVSERKYTQLFARGMGIRMLEWALSVQTDVFIGNVHSPFSRNVCLHRKTHGRAYNIIRGFGELRKVWSWHL